MTEYIYAARNSETGELVNNITSPPRKFWIREQNCRVAISRYNKAPTSKPRAKLKLAKFKLVEVPTNEYGA